MVGMLRGRRTGHEELVKVAKDVMQPTGDVRDKSLERLSCVSQPYWHVEVLGKAEWCQNSVFVMFASSTGVWI